MRDAGAAVLEAGSAARHLPPLRQHHPLDHGHFHDHPQLDHTGDPTQVEMQLGTLHRYRLKSVLQVL